MKQSKIISTLLICSLAASSLFITPADAAKKDASKVSFSNKVISLNVGARKTIKLKGVNKKIKWKIKNTKIAKIVAKKGKFKNKITIEGLKKGSTKITAKYKSQKYTAKIKVLTAFKDEKEATTTKSGTSPNAAGTNGNTNITETTANVKDPLTMSVSGKVNKDDNGDYVLALNYTISENGGDGSYVFTPGLGIKLEKKVDNNWVDLPIRYGYFNQTLVYLSRSYSNTLPIYSGEAYEGIAHYPEAIAIPTIESGTYRFSQTVSDWQNNLSVTVSSEFTIHLGETATESETTSYNLEDHVAMTVSGNIDTDENGDYIFYLDYTIKTNAKDAYLTFTHGNNLKLQKKVDDNWVEIPMWSGAFHETLVYLSPYFDHTETLTIYSGKKYEDKGWLLEAIAIPSIENGTYRFVQYLYDHNSNTSIPVSAEFTINTGETIEHEIKAVSLICDKSYKLEKGEDYSVLPFTFSINNTTDSSIIVENYFRLLEVKKGDEWEEVPVFVGPHNEMLYTIRSGEAANYNMPITVGLNPYELDNIPLYSVIIQNLEPGHYRYTHYYSTDLTDLIPVSAEFDVIEDTTEAETTN
ncbi:MAG: hypothetical protein E7254_05145 [Lachnospiraceae bacterium]|nr:hypothetical protein [Lachnospiraceae bacterium]